MFSHPLLRKLRPDRWRIEASSMPCVQLEQRHLGRLRVVKDRQSLLGLLPPGGVVAELGVAQGNFSAEILLHNRPACLHLVDCWSTPRFHEGFNRVHERFERQIKLGQVQVHRGRSTDILAQFADGFFDWLYIDTTHSYRQTAAELEIGRRKLKPGGILTGHDYVTGNWDGRRRYGVVEAVNEFCVRHDWEFLYLTHETDRHLSFAIRSLKGSAE